MATLPRVLIAAALFYLAFLIFREAQHTYSQPDPDATKVVLLFGGLIIVGAVGAVLLVTVVLPALGDAVGNLFFSPNAQPGATTHAAALSALARGDFDGALEEYRKAYEADPTDSHAVAEIAKIYAEHLENPDGAAEVLEQVLQAEWSPEKLSFLRARLADIRWNYHRDGRTARDLLMSIIGEFPGTPQAANATHKLQELERQIAAEG